MLLIIRLTLNAVAGKWCVATIMRLNDLSKLTILSRWAQYKIFKKIFSSYKIVELSVFLCKIWASKPEITEKLYSKSEGLVLQSIFYMKLFGVGSWRPPLVWSIVLRLLVWEWHCRHHDSFTQKKLCRTLPTNYFCMVILDHVIRYLNMYSIHATRTFLFRIVPKNLHYFCFK